MLVKRKRKAKPPMEPDWKVELLLTGEMPRGPKNPWEALHFEYTEEPQRQLWEEIRARELPLWIKRHPATRPYAWWRFEAPEEKPDSESQASYLQRHGLLTKAEKRRLQPADFEPENIRRATAHVKETGG